MSETPIHDETVVAVDEPADEAQESEATEDTAEEAQADDAE